MNWSNVLILPHDLSNSLDYKEVEDIFPNLVIEMKRNRYSQRDLAKYIGISYSSLQNKLRGQTQFTLNEMKTIQSAFQECSLDYLFVECSKKE